MAKVNVAVSDESKLKSSSTKHQIIDQTIQTRLSDQFRPYYLISGMLFVFASLEWYRWFEDLPPVPIVMSILFLISAVIAYVKQRQFRQELGFLNHGRQGENPVFEYIQNIIAENSARVFRDVEINEYFCKYIISAQSGLLLIDVIDLPPPENGEANIVYKNKKLTLNGYPMDRDPVADLKIACASLHKILLQNSNKDFPIYGAVVFPNWYVKQQDASEVQVVNPRQLPDMYRNLTKSMTHEDQSLASYHLNKYIRATN